MKFADAQAWMMIKKNLVPIVLVFVGLTSTAASATVSKVLNASPYKGPYAAIKAVLGPTATKDVADCSHIGMESLEDKKHIKKVFDQTLKKWVFQIVSHWDDKDCVTHLPKKSRTEMKVDKDSPLTVNALKDYGAVTIWSFFIKLDDGFVPTDSFTHLFQAKAESSNDDKPDPRIRLSLYERTISKSNENDQTIKKSILELNSYDDTNGFTHLVAIDATPLIGQWMQVTLKAKWSDQGYFEFTLKNIFDGEILINCKKSNIDLWDSNWEYMRFKAGIYREYDLVSSMRDVTARFSNIKLAKKKVMRSSNTMPECVYRKPS